jgi:hypothetical protein
MPFFRYYNETAFILQRRYQSIVNVYYQITNMIYHTWLMPKLQICIEKEFQVVKVNYIRFGISL